MENKSTFLFLKTIEDNPKLSKQVQVPLKTNT